MKQRRWFNRTLGGLQRRGYVEKLNVLKKTGRGYERCIKLIMMYDMNNSKMMTSKQKFLGSVQF